MSLYGALGIAVLSAFLLLILRDAGSRLSPLVAVAGGILLLSFLLLRYGTILGFLRELPLGEEGMEALTLSLRVLGICFLTEMCASLCRDMGEGGLATRVEWCGRAEILLCTLPSLSKMIEYATRYLGS